MTDQTPDDMIFAFEDTARADFERRLSEVSGQMHVLLTRVPEGGAEFDARTVTRMLLSITEDERYFLLNRMIGNTSGPKTLEGMEELRSFIANYLLDDSECLVVPEPDEPASDFRYDTIRNSVGFQEGNEHLGQTELDALALAEYMRRDKGMVVTRKPTDEGRCARSAEVVEAIRFNRERENARTRGYIEVFGEDCDEVPEILPPL
jgi:hypothetical protein